MSPMVRNSTTKPASQRETPSIRCENSRFVAVELEPFAQTSAQPPSVVCRRVKVVFAVDVPPQPEREAFAVIAFR
jgi:hypothetical protein